MIRASLHIKLQLSEKYRTRVKLKSKISPHCSTTNCLPRSFHFKTELFASYFLRYDNAKKCNGS